MSDIVDQTWPPGLPFDLALGLKSQAEILQDYAVTEDQWAVLQHNILFRREISRLGKELADTGMTFKLKARMLAETYLEQIDNIVMDRDTAVAIRLDAIKAMVKWADLEPKKEGSDGGGGPTFNLQINVG